jgi:hypothetical protein
MIPRQARKLVAQVEPSPGYVLDYSRNELADIIDDKFNHDLDQFPGSNSKRLTALFETLPDDEALAIISYLKETNDN